MKFMNAAWVTAAALCWACGPAALPTNIEGCRVDWHCAAGLKCIDGQCGKRCHGDAGGCADYADTRPVPPGAVRKVYCVLESADAGSGKCVVVDVIRGNE